MHLQLKQSFKLHAYVCHDVCSKGCSHLCGIVQPLSKLFSVFFTLQSAPNTPIGPPFRHAQPNLRCQHPPGDFAGVDVVIVGRPHQRCNLVLQVALALPLALRVSGWMSCRCSLGRRWIRRWILRLWLILELLLCLSALTLIAVISWGCCTFPDCSLQDPRVRSVYDAFIMIDDSATLVSRY